MCSVSRASYLGVDRISDSGVDMLGIVYVCPSMQFRHCLTDQLHDRVEIAKRKPGSITKLSARAKMRSVTG